MCRQPRRANDPYFDWRVFLQYGDGLLFVKGISSSHEEQEMSFIDLLLEMFGIALVN